MYCALRIRHPEKVTTRGAGNAGDFGWLLPVRTGALASVRLTPLRPSAFRQTIFSRVSDGKRSTGGILSAAYLPQPVERFGRCAQRDQRFKFVQHLLPVEGATLTHYD